VSETWNTKYGVRRVRHDPPTLSEAVFAATGLSDDPAEQAEIAASLMGVPLDEVRGELAKLLRPARNSRVIEVARTGQRAVVVERKTPRRRIIGSLNGPVTGGLR